MDKYERQSQKSKLWARRRNTTADLLLDGQLRYLERRCRQEVKQYLRKKSRLQEELRDIFCVSDGADLNHVTLDDPKQLSKKSSSKQVHNILGVSKAKTEDGTRSKLSRPHTTPKRDRSSENRISNINSLESDLRSENKNCHTNDIIADRNKSELSNPNNAHLLGTSSKLEVLQPNTGDKLHTQPPVSSQDISSTFVSLESSGPSTRRACRFNRDQRNVKSPCKHFPCSVPNTYHSLGFRRDDIGDWFLGKENNHDSCVSVLDTDETTKSKTIETKTKRIKNNVDSSLNNLPTNETRDMKKQAEGGRDLDTVACEKFDNIKRKDRSSESKPAELQWSIKIPPRKEFSLRPESGPAFGPKPPDPILEFVRSGMTQVLNTDKQPPRVTVAGRMRGLKSLVLELREKHERSKPVDWAVNYGQRLPMRVLLNPVFPVTI